LILSLLLILFSGCEAETPDIPADTPPDPPPEGHVWVYCLTERSSGKGYSLTFVYDEYGNLLEHIKTLDNGGTGKTIYDAQGNLLQENTNDGPVTYTYNENGDVLTAKSRYSDIKYTYDEQGNCISWSFLNADGTARETYQNTYDEHGNRTSMHIYGQGETTPGNSTEWDYDEYGNVLEERRYLNGELYLLYRYSYDQEGRILTEDTESYGQPKSGSTHTYNAAGNKVLTTRYLHEDGQYYESSSVWIYDENENLLEWKETSWHGDVSILVATYDISGNKLTETYTPSYGSKRYAEWTYDTAGNVLSEYRDWYGIVYTTFIYDHAGRLIQKHVYSGKNGSKQSQYLWSYDDAGNLLSFTYPVYESSPQTINYTYDRIAVPIELAEKVRAEQAAIWQSMEEQRHQEIMDGI